jgi:hypothetical protein
MTGNDLAPTIINGTNTTVVNNGATIQINAAGGGGSGQSWSTLSTSITAAINTSYEVIVSGGPATAFFPAGAQTADSTIEFKVISVGSPVNTFTIQPYTGIDGSINPITSNRLNEFFKFKYGLTQWWQVS